jgi:hypothetical protein
VKLGKIEWLGTRTEKPEAMADFFGKVLGLRLSHTGHDEWVFQLPDGSKAEVLAPRRTSTLPGDRWSSSSPTTSLAQPAPLARMHMTKPICTPGGGAQPKPL